MSRVRTLTDPHLFDERVAQKRGYSCAAEADAILLDNLMSVTTKRDLTIWLGDMTRGNEIDRMLKWVAPIPGEHRLAPGNHCPPHPMHRTAPNHMRRYLTVFTAVQAFYRRKIGGHDVVMSHFPIAGDHTDVDRYQQWRLRPFPGVLLHGHTHSTEKVSWAGETLQINVAPEAWGLRPVSDDEIVALIEAHR